jgi:serine/threonine protein kinase
VDGFTLEDYFAKRDRHRNDLPSAAVRDKAKELLSAVEWLYGKGFVHVDMNFGNIMYDRASGKLVLIDFENVKRSKDNELNYYELSLRLLKDGLAAELRSLGP